MGIKIVNQTNEQECGVCALTAMYNNFYKDSLSKEQVLEHSHITENGMTIFDLESLGQQLGLECESYEIDFNEFSNLKINSYFILLVSTGSSNNHYVIGRKQKKYIEIYDSCSMEMNKVSYKQLQKIFLNVIILVKRHPNKTFNKVFGKARTLLLFDLKFVLLNLGLSLLLLGVSVGCASFLNFIIDLSISKGSVNNLITICFIFILVYFSNDILTYVSNLYMSKHIKNYFVLFTSKILSCLESKKSDFLNKVDQNWIFKVDECVYNISNFCIVEINKFITSIVFCFVCICIIGSIQYYLLIFVLLYGVIELIFFLFAYRKKKEVFMNIVRNENNNAQHYKNLINSLTSELWSAKRHSIISKIKNNYSAIYKNYSDVILFKSNTALFKSLLKSLMEIFVIAIMSYFIIKTNELSIGQLTFGISAFALYRNSLGSFFNYFLAKLEFDVYWQVYKDLTTVSNVEKDKQIKLIQHIKTISFQLDKETYELKTSNNQLPLPIIDLIQNASRILINDQKQKNNKQLLDSFIVVDSNSSIDISLIMKQIEKQPLLYSQYLRYFKIDLNNKQSFYQNIIINLLCLLSEKHKIIFIDDVLKYIKKKDKVVVKQLINKIKRTNNVFVIGKEEND